MERLLKGCNAKIFVKTEGPGLKFLLSSKIDLPLKNAPGYLLGRLEKPKTIPPCCDPVTTRPDTAQYPMRSGPGCPCFSSEERASKRID